MTANFEVADGDRFEVDERGQPRFQSPFPTSWGAVPSDAEERRTWVADHARALPPTGKQALTERETGTEVEQRSDTQPKPDALTAAIAQQTAATAARESQPGRYDGVAIKDLARHVEMEHMAIAALRAENAAAPLAEPDARLRALAERSPQAAAAFGLLNAGAPVIVPIDESGALLTQPARDPDVLASWWEPGGPYSTCWPAVPCGEQGGLFGLLCFPGEGAAWLRKTATVHRPTRVERLMAAVTDRITEMGVPPTGGGGWDDDEPPPKPDEVRATVHARLWLVEDQPRHRPVVRAWAGSLRGREGQAAMAAAIPPQPRQLSAMVWSWPAGQTLPVGRELRAGVWSLRAVAALGAPLTIGGVRFIVRQTPALLSPPPSWLVEAVQDLA